MIGGKPFRTGFLEATWGAFRDPHSPEAALIAKRENVLSFGDDLFHYTSLPGLQGIIESGGFWASDNRFMNDAEEMRNGVRLAAKALDHRSRRTALQPFALVLASVRKLLLQQPREGHLVACFSTAADSLEQWRGYGSSGGVCLRLRKPEAGERHVFFGPDHVPFAAFYKWQSKMVLLLSIIRRFEREYELDRRAMASAWPDDHDENYAKELYDLLSGRILAFKDSAFRQESEVRIALSHAKAPKYGGLRFRATPFGLVPYVCTGDLQGDTGPLPLREVMVGPAARQELIADSLRTFLVQNGYGAVPVTLSQVPYRA